MTGCDDRRRWRISLRSDGQKNGRFGMKTILLFFTGQTSGFLFRENGVILQLFPPDNEDNPRNRGSEKRAGGRER